MVPNARFWLFDWMDWVKITLRPGQSLSWSRFSTDEEGWSKSGWRITHAGSHLVIEGGTDEKDCDGRGGTSYTMACPMDKLHSSPTLNVFQKDWTRRCWNSALDKDTLRPVLRVAWEKISREQFDQFAEAAGY